MVSPFKSPLKLFLALLLPFLARALGSMVTEPSIPSWYENLNKPAINPPNWLFAPVWTALYISMGVAFYLIWTSASKKPEKKIAIYLFLAQLVVNSLWSVFFFGWLNVWLGLLIIIALWCLILAVTLLFFRIKKTAAYLMIPYLAWVSFATYLNFAIWQLN